MTEDVSKQGKQLAPQIWGAGRKGLRRTRKTPWIYPMTGPARCNYVHFLHQLFVMRTIVQYCYQYFYQLSVARKHTGRLANGTHWPAFPRSTCRGFFLLPASGDSGWYICVMKYRPAAKTPLRTATEILLYGPYPDRGAG